MTAAPVGEVVDLELGALLLDLTGLVKQSLDECVEPLGLAPAHAVTLHVVREPRRMGDVAAQLGFDPSHVTAIVDRLEEAGLVRRASDPEDRRAKLIHLTSEGAAVLDRLERGVVERLSRHGSLTSGQRSQLRTLLTKLLGGTSPTPS